MIKDYKPKFKKGYKLVGYYDHDTSLEDLQINEIKRIFYKHDLDDWIYQYKTIDKSFSFDTCVDIDDKFFHLPELFRILHGV